MLSQYMTGAAGISIPSSVSREHNNRTSEAAFATALYSASVEDLATPLCFLDDQEIGFYPR